MGRLRSFDFEFASDLQGYGESQEPRGVISQGFGESNRPSGKIDGDVTIETAPQITTAADFVAVSSELFAVYETETDWVAKMELRDQYISLQAQYPQFHEEAMVIRRQQTAQHLQQIHVVEQ